MTIWNLGSINVDHVYTVPHFVAPGETLTADGYSWGLGGKGLNQSVAAMRSNASVEHLGAIGADDAATAAALEQMNITPRWRVAAATGHAIIQVNGAGENCIVLAPGANRAMDEGQIKAALKKAQPGDWLLLQNETNGARVAVAAAKAAGLKVAYAAAPFDADAIEALINQIDLLSVNEVELGQLEAALGANDPRLAKIAKLVTLGSKGAYFEDADGNRTHQDAYQVEAMDTTGAGDTFLGAFMACRDQGKDLAASLRWASAAGALQVTRLGAASVIPQAEEIELFLTEVSA